MLMTTQAAGIVLKEVLPARMPLRTGAMSPGDPMSVSDSSAERPPAAAASVVFTAILLASLMHPYMHPAGAEQLSISVYHAAMLRYHVCSSPAVESQKGPW